MKNSSITNLLFLSLLVSGFGSNTAFQTSHILAKHQTRHVAILRSSMVEDSNTNLEEEIRAMRAKDIKSELTNLGVSTVGLFEKEDLVQRLVERRREAGSTQSSNVESSSSDHNAVSSSGELCIPLYFTTFNKEMRIASVNQDAGITVNASDEPYPAIKVEVDENGSTLTLLLDTACSGLVLRPSVVEKLNLPKLSTSVTMTGAGGSTAAQGLTKLSYTVGGKKFGPEPAATQDIGALPASLDGIIGLAFLKQFKCIDMDFVKGELRLHDDQNERSTSDSSIVSKGSMSIVPQLGLYATDIYLGSRGPVKMLVDSGASHSILNWKGIAQLGIPRDDTSFLKRLPNPMGAMGSDNTVAALTHRIHVSSFLRLGEGDGLSLQNGKRLSIDIGDMAILSSLEPYGICGILGVDALMRCSSVRLQFGPSTSEIYLME